MNNALKQVMTDRRLNIKSKAIYSYFDGLCFDKNSCYPSRKKIAYDLNVNYETPKKYIDELVYYGYLEVVKTRENNRFSNNLYVLIRKEKRVPSTNAGVLNWRR